MGCDCDSESETLRKFECRRRFSHIIGCRLKFAKRLINNIGTSL